MARARPGTNLQLPGHGCESTIHQSCLVQVGYDIELEAVGPHWQFEPSGYRWRPCGVTWDYSRTVVVIKLLLTSALLRP